MKRKQVDLYLRDGVLAVEELQHFLGQFAAKRRGVEPRLVAKLGTVVFFGSRTAQDHHLWCPEFFPGNPLRLYQQCLTQTSMLGGILASLLQGNLRTVYVQLPDEG